MHWMSLEFLAIIFTLRHFPTDSEGSCHGISSIAFLISPLSMVAVMNVPPQNE